MDIGCKIALAALQLGNHFKWTISGFFLHLINMQNKTADYCSTQTRIVGVEGDHTDHWTTTTAGS